MSTVTPLIMGAVAYDPKVVANCDTFAMSLICSRCPTASMIPSACLALMIGAVKRRNFWQISSHVNGFRGEPLWGLVGRV